MSQTKLLLKEIIEDKIQKEEINIDISNLDDIYLNETQEKIDISKIYEKTIDLISKNDFDNAIKYLVFILDLNNEHQETIHLCKSILYNISSFLSEKKSDTFIEKYGSLKQANKDLTAFIDKSKQEMQTFKENLSIQEKRRFSNDSNLSPKEIIQNIVEFKKNILNLDIEIKKAEREIQTVKRLYKLEVYGIIISTVIEATLFPELYQ